MITVLRRSMFILALIFCVGTLQAQQTWELGEDWVMKILDDYDNGAYSSFLEENASDPPRSITAFPAFKQRPAASMVTFGLDS